MIKDLTHEKQCSLIYIHIGLPCPWICNLTELWQVEQQRCQVQVNLYQYGGGGRGDMVLLQLLARVLGRSPGHAGVRTVPDIRLQRSVRHLHQRCVRGQLWGTRMGKLMEMKPKSHHHPARTRLTLFRTGLVERTLYRVFSEMFWGNTTGQSSVNTGGVRLCSLGNKVDAATTHTLGGLVHTHDGRSSAIIQEQRLLPVVVVGLQDVPAAQF